MNIRNTLFWIHLILGCSAALFIFVMSITGVALTYERQMIKSAQRADYPVAPANQTQSLAIAEFVTLAEKYSFKKAPKIIISNEDNAPVVLKDGRKTVAQLNPFTGEELAPLGAGTTEFFKKLRAFHRWLTFDGSFSDSGRWVNGIANAFFVILVITGIYIWLPKQLRKRAFKQKLTLSGNYASKQARNYQWHNVFGIYMMPVLFVVAFTALFFSFKWPGQALKDFASTESVSLIKPVNLSVDKTANTLTIDQQLTQIKSDFTQWQTISFEIPKHPTDVHIYQIDNGNGGEPQKRVSIALNTLTGDVVEQQSFEQLSEYRKARSYIRFLHTGEVFGLLGQTVAGLASLLACLLVYTGVLLSWRRWQNSRAK